MPDKLHIPCPACGFLTLEEAYGSYTICDVCAWEDDHVQLANPACGGGANAESLIKAQAKVLARFSVSEATVQPTARDPKWRPLNETEKRIAERERDDRYWKNQAICNLAQCYWLKPPDA